MTQIPRCVVLDVDDTLYLEVDYVASGFAAVGDWLHRSKGIAGFAAVAQRLFDEGVRGTVFDAALASLGGGAELGVRVDELVEVYRTHTPAIELLPDAERFLDFLARSAIPVAIITDGPLTSQAAKVEALGLQSRAELIILTAALGHGFAKPHAKAFLQVEDYFGLARRDCMYIADNPLKDFVAPRTLGWQTIRVSRPRGLHQRVASGADVDRSVATLDDLVSLRA